MRGERDIWIGERGEEWEIGIKRVTREREQGETVGSRRKVTRGEWGVGRETEKDI